MRNPYTDNSSFVRNIYKKQYLNKIEEPIIDKYYEDVRKNQKPQLEDIISNPDENQIRNIIINQLSPLLKNQTSNFVEKLINDNDLMAFYKFGKLFINQIKDIRNLDSTFLSDLWEKFKNKMLIETYPKTNKIGMTADEYEKILGKNIFSNFTPDTFNETPGMIQPAYTSSTINKVMSKFGNNKDLEDEIYKNLSNIKKGQNKKITAIQINKPKQKQNIQTPILKPSKIKPSTINEVKNLDIGELGFHDPNNPYGYKKNPQTGGYTNIPRTKPKSQKTGFPPGRPTILNAQNLAKLPDASEHSKPKSSITGTTGSTKGSGFLVYHRR